MRFRARLLREKLIELKIPLRLMPGVPSVPLRNRTRSGATLDSTRITSAPSAAQPRGRVRDGENPTEVGDANSFKRQRHQMMPSRCRLARSHRRGRGACRGSRVVLAEARRAAAQLPRRAAEHARRTWHSDHARSGMVVLDEKSARFVLLDFQRLRSADSPGSMARARPAPS